MGDGDTAEAQAFEWLMPKPPPCYNWKCNRLVRIAAQMRDRYLHTGSGCAAQRKALEQRLAEEKRRHEDAMKEIDDELP